MGNKTNNPTKKLSKAAIILRVPEPRFLPPTKVERVLAGALHKLKPSHNPREWCAALTAAEALALLKDGYRLSPSNNYQKADFEKAQAAGEGGTSWCYFTKVGKHRPTTAVTHRVKKPTR